MHANLNDKVVQLMTSMSSKADKEDVQELSVLVRKFDERLTVVEKKAAEFETKKQTIINLGNMGIKGWGLISAAIALFLALFSRLTK